MQSAKRSTAYTGSIQENKFRYEPHGYLSPTSGKPMQDVIVEGSTEQEVEFQEAEGENENRIQEQPRSAQRSSKTGQRRVQKDANVRTSTNKGRTSRAVTKKPERINTKSKTASSTRRQRDHPPVSTVHSRNRKSSRGADPPTSGAVSVVSSLADGPFSMEPQKPVEQILTSRTETKDERNRTVIVEEYSAPSTGNSKHGDVATPSNPDGTELVKVRTEYGLKGTKTIKDVTHCDGSRTVTTTIDQPDINDTGMELTFDEDEKKKTNKSGEE